MIFLFARCVRRRTRGNLFGTTHNIMGEDKHLGRDRGRGGGKRADCMMYYNNIVRLIIGYSRPATAGPRPYGEQC